jgi:hypothetical protein
MSVTDSIAAIHDYAGIKSALQHHHSDSSPIGAQRMNLWLEHREKPAMQVQQHPVAAMQ